jgi:hypothetical protein
MLDLIYKFKDRPGILLLIKKEDNWRRRKNWAMFISAFRNALFASGRPPKEPTPRALKKGSIYRQIGWFL